MVLCTMVKTRGFVGEKHTSDPPVGGVVLTKITVKFMPRNGKENSLLRGR